MFTVQDPPAPPADTLLLLKCLYKTNVRIQEWTTNVEKSNNHRMIQQLVFHEQQIIKVTSVQDLDPRTCSNNAHVSVLTHEMVSIEPGENPSGTLTWKPLGFLNHIKCRTNDERFSSSQWESFFCSSLGVPTRALIGPAQQCACNALT